MADLVQTVAAFVADHLVTILVGLLIVLIYRYVGLSVEQCYTCFPKFGDFQRARYDCFLCLETPKG